jgi:Flp pilus assembly pilin Flp
MSPEVPKFKLDPQSEDGQAMVEYALILALVTVVALAALTAVGTNVAALLDALATLLEDIAAGL